MAKKKAATRSGSTSTAAKKTAKPTAKGIVIELRRNCTVGEKQGKAGDKLGTIQLEPGVNLNFLVDAIRNDLAGEKRKKPTVAK